MPYKVGAHKVCQISFSSFIQIKLTAKWS